MRKLFMLASLPAFIGLAGCMPAAAPAPEMAPMAEPAMEAPEMVFAEPVCDASGVCS